MGIKAEEFLQVREDRQGITTKCITWILFGSWILKKDYKRYFEITEEFSVWNGYKDIQKLWLIALGVKTVLLLYRRMSLCFKDECRRL